MYKAKSGPSAESCEALYESVTLSVRVSVMVIPRPTKLGRGINVTSDGVFFHIAHTHPLGGIQAPFGVYEL